jgi:hypothetical protein
VYLLLASARGLWRTQFLSGLGAAITWSAVLAMVASVLAARARAVALVSLVAVIVWTGSLAALQLGAAHRRGWEAHRAVIVDILAVAPSVRPGTFVVLRNVPRAADPFGDAMWLDAALRLVYPGIKVSGGYYLDDGSPAAGHHMSLAYGRWFWDGARVLPDVGETSLKNTLFLTMQPGGGVSIDRALPEGLCLSDCDASMYNPSPLIDGPLSERAMRRYRIGAK